MSFAGHRRFLERSFMSEKTVDIVVLTYRPDQKFLKLMEMLQKQNVRPKRIIIMNTEEKYLERLLYGTRFVDKNPNVEVHHLSKKEFDHGATRSHAADYSSADFLIYMTQDAVPADEYMVQELLKPMDDPEVQISYARQLPSKDAGPIEIYNRNFNYPDHDRVQDKEVLPELGIKTYFCSDVCACYRRSYFENAGRFVSRAIFNEDMVFAASVVNAGKKVYYASNAKVVHSHNYKALQQFRRNFDLGVSQADHPEVFAGVKSEKEGVRLVKGSIDALLEAGKFWMIPGFFVHCGARYIGFKLGLKYKSLSKKIIWKFTSNRSYWTRYWDLTLVPDDVYAGYGKNKEGL